MVVLEGVVVELEGVVVEMVQGLRLVEQEGVEVTLEMVQGLRLVEEVTVLVEPVELLEWG